MAEVRRTAVVTGASSGIGAATARQLAAAGFRVYCAARRGDRLAQLAREIDGVAVQCDVTSGSDIHRLADQVGQSLSVLVNNAGVALGLDPIADASLGDWRAMYDVNVIGTLAVTQALLPALVASGDGVIVNMSSTAGHLVYEGGGGYTAAKHGVAALTETLRLELHGLPVRVTEICPGLVATEEFTLVRFGGDQARRDAVYAGVPGPLTADDVADAVTWVVSRPAHVDIDQLVIRPRAQAAQHKLLRDTQPAAAPLSSPGG
ncbi:MAG: SDR family NAD(P)-dependent oxidoreductase [Trebonia sp.]